VQPTARGRRAALVRQDEHGAVDDVHVRGRVAGRERRVAGDHDQLVAGRGQLRQRRLALRLRRVTVIR
jgi:hypothetical protein